MVRDGIAPQQPRSAFIARCEGGVKAVTQILDGLNPSW
jgi:hypothetical protein